MPLLPRRLREAIARTSISAKLVAAVTASTLGVAAAVGSIAITNSDILANRLRSTNDDLVLSLWAATQVDEAVHDIQVSFIRALSRTDLGGTERDVLANLSRLQRRVAAYEARYSIPVQPRMQTLLRQYDAFQDQHRREQAALANIRRSLAELRNTFGTSGTATPLHLASLGSARVARVTGILEETRRDVDVLMRIQLEQANFGAREGERLGNRTRLLILFVAISGTILALGLALALVRPVLTGITSLTSATRQLESGAFDKPIRVASRDELHTLASSFNRMAMSLSAKERELREAMELAEQGSRVKSEFLATMSHEIRTPMNGVIGMLGLLEDTPLTPRQRDMVDTAHSSAEHLLTLINDILDFSRIEAGKLSVDRVAFDPVAELEHVLTMIGTRAAEKDLDVLMRVVDRPPRLVMGDAGRVRQVLTNFAGNAVKFTESGSVVLAMECEASDGEDVVLRFTVSDSGIGIPADRLGEVFEQFTQADASTTRRYGGTGLGLTISKRLVEMMGGELGVTSTPGHGSAFWFRLRMPVAAEPLRLPSRAAALAGLNILVVDDRPTRRGAVEGYLRAWGMRVDSATDGDDALAMIRARDTGSTPYDMVLVQDRLPDTMGVSLALAIREMPADPSPLIILCAAAAPTDTETREFGLAGTVMRPIRPSRLLDILVAARERHTGSTRSRTPPDNTRVVTPLSVRPVGPQPRVLVVDDNAVNQKVALMTLQKLGCAADAAANGAEAVQRIGLLPYDLVLMDCEMPVLDGFAATREIRRREGGRRHLPIIAMTAKAIAGDRERCLAAGMDDYLPKPLRVEDLANALSRWLVRTGAALASPPAGPAVPPAPSPSPVPVAPPRAEAPMEGPLEQDAINRLRELAQDTEPELFGRILHSYLGDAERQMSAIRTAMPAGDCLTVRAAAHSLKGASSQVGAMQVMRLAMEIEVAGARGDVPAVAEPLAALEREWMRVRRALEAEMQAAVG